MVLLTIQSRHSACFTRANFSADLRVAGGHERPSETRLDFRAEVPEGALPIHDASRSAPPSPDGDNTVHTRPRAPEVPIVGPSVSLRERAIRQMSCDSDAARLVAAWSLVSASRASWSTDLCHHFCPGAVQITSLNQRDELRTSLRHHLHIAGEHRISWWRSILARRPVCVCGELHPCVRNPRRVLQVREVGWWW